MSDWERIVDEHGRLVFRIGLRILGSVQDAEDVAQDVFCEAYQFQQSQRVESWSGLLARLATLRAIDRLRRKRSTMELGNAEPISASGPFEEAAARELAELLRAAVGRLPNQQAAVFSLVYFEQMSRDEVSANLGISPEAVSTALFKARRRLESQLPTITREIRDE